MNLILYTYWLLMLLPAVYLQAKTITKKKTKNPRFDTKYFTDVPSKGYVPIVFNYKPDKTKTDVHSSSPPTSKKPRQTTKNLTTSKRIITNTRHYSTLSLYTSRGNTLKKKKILTKRKTTTTPIYFTKKILTRDELLVDLFGPASNKTHVLDESWMEINDMDFDQDNKDFIPTHKKTKGEIWDALSKSEKRYKSEEILSLFTPDVYEGFAMEGDPDGIFYYQPTEKRKTSSRRPYIIKKGTDKQVEDVKRKSSSKKRNPSTIPWHNFKTRKTSSTKTKKSYQDYKHHHNKKGKGWMETLFNYNSKSRWPRPK